VICDVETLRSLETRDYTSGLAEVAKYGFINPNVFPDAIETSVEQIKVLDPAVLVSVVATCAGMKSEVVSADEREAGLRAVLNYGHTLGHALEAATEYEGAYTHGEAVSVGMVFAALVAESVGLASGGLSERHVLVLKSLGLPVAPLAPAPGFEALVGHIAQDKKSRGDLTMVLLEKEGSPVVRGGLEWDTLDDCYTRLLEGA
jgi:3-dehydroquinate synthase